MDIVNSSPKGMDIVNSSPKGMDIVNSSPKGMDIVNSSPKGIDIVNSPPKGMDIASSSANTSPPNAPKDVCGGCGKEIYEYVTVCDASCGYTVCDKCKPIATHKCKPLHELKQTRAIAKFRRLKVQKDDFEG